MTDIKKKPDWTVPDKDGNMNIPDQYDSLFNQIGMQMRFHKISGKNEIQTITDILWLAEKFFNEKFEKEKSK